MTESDPPSDATIPTPGRFEHYMERAQRMRELAAQTPDPDVRQDLLTLSLRYDHLAHRAKTHEGDDP